MLGPSLFDFLVKNNYRSFPVDLVCELGRQPLECVAFVVVIWNFFHIFIYFSWCFIFVK